MICGVLLFGSNSKSFALNSFSIYDPLGLFSRIAFGFSVLASFPLIFLSIRSTFLLQAKKYYQPLNSIKKMTFLLLFIISLLASKFTDIGIIGSIAGAILGTSMMLIFPPIMYTGALIQQANKNGTRIPMIQIFMNGVMTIGGICLGLLGVINSIQPFLKH